MLAMTANIELDAKPFDVGPLNDFITDDSFLFTPRACYLVVYVPCPISEPKFGDGHVWRNAERRGVENTG